MRDCDHASTSATFHAVQFSESFIGLGNLPALVHAQIDEPETPRRSLRGFKRINSVGSGATDCCEVVCIVDSIKQLGNNVT